MLAKPCRGKAAYPAVLRKLAREVHPDRGTPLHLLGPLATPAKGEAPPEDAYRPAGERFLAQLHAEEAEAQEEEDFFPAFGQGEDDL